jgi:hypothetical protein
MDLTNEHPRSAKDKLAGIVSLKRTIDKSKANDEGHLGDYHYDCPHDKPLFAFLGTDAADFTQQVKTLKTDDAIAAWVKSDGLAGKSQADIDAFNTERMKWHPDPGTDSAAYFDQTRKEVAPDRPEIVTWFDLLDLDEGRPVPEATRI